MTYTELLEKKMNDEQNIIIYRTADGKASVALYAKDGKIWLNQQQMAELFATSKQTVSYHIINVLKDKELVESSVVKEYLTTAADGKNYNVVFYSLEMIIARQIYDEFDTNRKQFEARLADDEDIKALEDLERSIIDSKQ